MSAFCRRQKLTGCDGTGSRGRSSEPPFTSEVCAQGAPAAHETGQSAHRTPDRGLTSRTQRTPDATENPTTRSKTSTRRRRLSRDDPRRASGRRGRCPPRPSQPLESTYTTPGERQRAGRRGRSRARTCMARGVGPSRVGAPVGPAGTVPSRAGLCRGGKANAGTATLGPAEGRGCSALLKGKLEHVPERKELNQLHGNAR